MSSTTVDISRSVEVWPTQPRNHKIPSTKFSGSLRAFNRSWFDAYPWLEYSIEKSAVFCYACRFFSTGQHQSETLVTSGFVNWKIATGKNGSLEKHNVSERHQHRMSASSDYTTN